MIGVMIIPTGLGCEIGGHAGDATPAAKLLASVCDKLILHPNVVNASDINEMPGNSLYVEGSTLDRFLGGEIGLKEVRANKILLAVNDPLSTDTQNAVNAARVTIGADISIVELETPLEMKSHFNRDGTASGDVEGWEKLVDQVRQYEFDALAMQTPIQVETNVALDYLRNGGVNPWGGVEAKASKLISSALDKPVAHAPLALNKEIESFSEVVDPREAAESVSICYLHCVLKGLHKAPRLTADKSGLSVGDVDFMISPMGCWGKPHVLCQQHKILIIMVRENTCIINKIVDSDFFVHNYLEAAGLIAAWQAGVHPDSVRRPIKDVEVLSRKQK